VFLGGFGGGGGVWGLGVFGWYLKFLCVSLLSFLISFRFVFLLKLGFEVCWVLMAPVERELEEGEVTNMF